MRKSKGTQGYLMTLHCCCCVYLEKEFSVHAGLHFLRCKKTVLLFTRHFLVQENGFATEDNSVLARGNKEHKDVSHQSKILHPV